MGWSQSELSLLSGYTRSTISQFESGARPIPTHFLVMLLALKRLDVEEIDDIFEQVFRLEPGEV